MDVDPQTSARMRWEELTLGSTSSRRASVLHSSLKTGVNSGCADWKGLTHVLTRSLAAART